jgi:hypothetical protein
MGGISDKFKKCLMGPSKLIALINESMREFNDAYYAKAEKKIQIPKEILKKMHEGDTPIVINNIVIKKSYVNEEEELKKINRGKKTA